jgi:predicted nucleic acid-binding protein
LPEEQNEASGGDASLSQREPVCILDAVICVHFVGASLQRLLVDVLKKADLVLLVPQEVCDEVARKDWKYQGLKLRWTRLTNSSCVQVLPPLEAQSAPDRVIEVFVEVRGRQREDALRDSKDLGEAVVVAHGVHYQDEGHEVLVAIDDQGGQALAADRNLRIITVEDVLAMAVEFGKFPTEGDLKKVYEKLRRFGDGLIPYGSTSLGMIFKEWHDRNPGA